MRQACNPSKQEAEAGFYAVQASLVYDASYRPARARYCLRKEDRKVSSINAWLLVISRVKLKGLHCIEELITLTMSIGP